MAILPATLESIAGQLQQQGVGETQLAALRSQYADIHFTYCSDDDVSNGFPVLERDTFNLYLVDGSSHCLQMTRDFSCATGIVLAEIEPD